MGEMKLAGAEAARFLAKPDPARAGVLIYGTDPMRVALKRQEAILALIGPAGEGEMRLSRMQAGELRKDPALLSDAMRAVGFFPGPRVAFVEDATDGLTAVSYTHLDVYKRQVSGAASPTIACAIGALAANAIGVARFR